MEYMRSVLGKIKAGGSLLVQPKSIASAFTILIILAFSSGLYPFYLNPEDPTVFRISLSGTIVTFVHGVVYFGTNVYMLYVDYTMHLEPLISDEKITVASQIVSKVLSAFTVATIFIMTFIKIRKHLIINRGLDRIQELLVESGVKAESMYRKLLWQSMVEFVIILCISITSVYHSVYFYEILKNESPSHTFIVNSILGPYYVHLTVLIVVAHIVLEAFCSDILNEKLKEHLAVNI